MTNSLKSISRNFPSYTLIALIAAGVFILQPVAAQEASLATIPNGFNPVLREELVNSATMICAGAGDDGSCTALMALKRSDDGAVQRLEEYGAADYIDGSTVIYRIEFMLFDSYEQACMMNYFGEDSVAVIGILDKNAQLSLDGLEPLQGSDLNAFKSELVEKLYPAQSGLLCIYASEANTDGSYNIFYTLDGQPLGGSYPALYVNRDQVSDVKLNASVDDLALVRRHMAKREAAAQAEVDRKDAAEEADRIAAEREEEAVRQAAEDDARRLAFEAETQALRRDVEAMIIDKSGQSEKDVESYLGTWLDLNRKLEVFHITHLTGSSVQIDMTRRSHGNTFGARPTRVSVVGEVIGGRLVINSPMGGIVMIFDPAKGVLSSHGAGTFLPINYTGDPELLLVSRVAEPFRQILRDRGITPE